LKVICKFSGLDLIKKIILPRVLLKA
jgi:hypothetical protein